VIDRRARSQELFEAHGTQIAAQTDRVFAFLLFAEWVFSIVCAFVVSPRAWQGTSSSVHIHVFASILLGAMLAIPAIAMAIHRPGTIQSRVVIAIAQASFSALLIHATGGRIETHFHVFGSLAFLAFYRDVRILVLASGIIALDHFVRGMWWPQSVFGLAVVSPWRWLEHAGWVVFEDVFLIWSCLRSRAEMRAVADRQAELEAVNESIENVVKERTAELAKARDEAINAARVKTEFLANMSHEIRTPMNGVLGFVQLLRSSRLDSAQAEYVKTIQESGETLLTILNDILDLSKIEAGKLDLERIPFRPKDVVEGAVRLFAASAKQKGLALTAETRGLGHCSVLGDPTRLRQILLNLIGNAIKFTEQGEVSIECKATALPNDRIELVLRVRDTGVGIAPEVQSQLFQPFRQADGSTTRRFGGSGLGLAISGRLAARMSGTIELVSAAGVGSTFSLKMPLDRAPPAIDSPETSPTPLQRQESEFSPGVNSTPPRQGARILVAEDNPVNQRLMIAMLRRLGHTPDVAPDGESAVRACLEKEYDLVLMDVHMPVLDGLEATRQLRALRTAESHRLPIIALTAHAMASHRAECLAAGMDDYITKPIAAGDLERALTRFVPDPAAARS
jgi:two-component system sensor histidine kinase/response regulator